VSQNTSFELILLPVHWKTVRVRKVLRNDMALHLTAIPLRSIAAGELGRSTQ
jgi:hypothetical protein